MLTEFEVRRRMESIQASPMPPLRKARMLLRLGRLLSPQVSSLIHAKAQIAQTDDRKSSACLTRMATSATVLREDLRDAAFSALHTTDLGGTFPN
jgi:hypothetical protein